MSSFKGKVNIYTCERCRGHVVTRDIDEGVTPFMMKCIATAGCTGTMKSSLYRVFDQSMAEDYRWRLASFAEMQTMKRSSRQHAEKGGLFLTDLEGKMVFG